MRAPPMEEPTRFSQDFVINEPTSEDDVLRQYAEFILEQCGGNKSVAARVLGIDRRSLYRRLGFKYASDVKRGSYGESKDELSCS